MIILTIAPSVHRRCVSLPHPLQSKYTDYSMKEFTLGSVIRSGAWGMLVGGVAGFTLGLFLAPEEGRQMRRRVAYQLEHLADRMGAIVDHLAQSDSRSEARRTGDQLVADAREKAQQIREDIDALLGEVRSGTSTRSTSPTD